MQFDDFQATADAMTATVWPDDTPGPELRNALMARLLEEVGELAKASRRCGQVRWGHPGEPPGTPDAVLDELGDNLLLLARVASLHGVSLNQAAHRVLHKFRQRLLAMTPPHSQKEGEQQR